MPKFLTDDFLLNIPKKGKRGYPFFYFAFLFLSLMYIDVIYKYFNHGILFDPDIIHILFIDLVIAALLMVALIIFPVFFRRHLLFLVLFLFASMGFLYTVLGFEGVITTQFNQIEVFTELSGRLKTNFEWTHILFFIPLVFGLIQFPIKYTKVKYASFVGILLISAVVGTWYLNAPKYNSSFEVTTNLEKLIYNDEEQLVFNRLGVNAGFLRNIINYDEYNITDSNNVLGLTDKYFRRTATTNQYSNDYRGSNLVVIEVDSLDSMALTADVMPTTVSMLQTGLYFPNYYDENTNDINFEFYTGIYEAGKTTNAVATYGSNSYPNAIGNQFARLGYRTSFVQNSNFRYAFEREFITRVGFYEKYDSYDYGSEYLSDLELVEATTHLFNDGYRFYVNYKLEGLKYEPNDYSEYGSSFASKDVDESLKQYFSYANEVDMAINQIITSLTQAGKLNNTVVVIASTGHPDYFDDDYIRENSSARPDVMIHRVPFIIWGEQQTEVIDEIMGSVNVVATLGNLFSFYGTPEYIGDDVFKAGENVVAFSNRSWVSNAGFYDAYQQTFSVSDEIYITDFLDEYIKNTNQMIYEQFLYSRIVLEKNYFVLQKV